MSKKSNKLQTIQNQPFKSSFLGSKYQVPVMMLLLVLIVSFMYFKISFLGYAPQASDTMQWRGSAQQIMEYNKTHWEKAQWTDNMFGGMPSYLISLPNQYPFMDQILRVFSFIIDWRIFFLIFGGLGMFVLLYHLKFDPMIALLGGLAFALSCHFIGLIDIGHNTKFKAITYIPWIFWAIDYLRQNRNLLGLGLSSVFLIQQLRENHPQISYYTYMLLAVYWIVCAIASFKEKQTRSYIGFSFLLLIAFFISALAVMNPYLSTMEYGKYTIRGGAEGLSKEYATGWSFGVGETFSLLVPKIYGGISPFYWGPMSFTQTSNYVGIIILFLAIMSVFLVRNRIVTALSIGSVLTLLLSYGKNWPLLYDVFFKYFPGFNKFRVPAMILVLIQFAFVVLAGYGLDYLIRKHEENPKVKKFIKTSFIIACLGFVLFLAGKSVFSSLSFMKPEELQQYQSGQIEQLKAIRLDLLVKSGMMSFFILIVSIGSIWMFITKKMNKFVMMSLLIILTLIDLSLVNKDHFKSDQLVKEKEMFTSFEDNGVDQFLKGDKDVYRIFPLAQQFGNARWSYNHQSLGGYHGAKLKRYQDMIEKSLHAELVQGIPLNWHIINMLNTKYIIFENQLPFPNLQEVYFDSANNLYVYKNLDVLPRAWFVDEVKSFKNTDEIINTMNRLDFNPATTALLEEDINNIEKADSNSVVLKSKELHKSQWEVYTNKPSFLVVSEIYYPAGWKFTVDGKETKMYPVNYVLRGIEVPAGKHTIEMKFEAKTYRLSILLSAIGLSLSVLCLIVGCFIERKKRKTLITQE